MTKGQNFRYISLLEIINKVDRILRQKKNIEQTFTEIVSTVPFSQVMEVPIRLKLTFNNEEFSSPAFENEVVCQQHHFATLAGNVGTIQLCLGSVQYKEKELKPLEQNFLLDSLLRNIQQFLNSTERNDQNTFNQLHKNTPETNGKVTSSFLQRFLNANTFNRDIYHDLMPYKVGEILLISSLYDAYAIEREGRFTEHMLGQYGQLNLTSFPRITGATSLDQALHLLNFKHFDLIIYMVGAEKKVPLTVSEQINKAYPFIPIFLLLNNSSDVSYYSKILQNIPYIDKLFTWNGDANIFFAMIKMLEDKLNVENDTQLGQVRVILLVEDSPEYYSRYLSFLYKVLMEQTKRIIDDVSTDELYKVLRMRARPKILLASNYEEALEIIDNYQDYMLCLVTDVKFDRNGVLDENAGIALLEYTRKKLRNLPAILQSSDSSYEPIARQHNSLFIHKQSDTLYQDLENFITNYLGFGDFEFKDINGITIARASNMREFEKNLKEISDESLIYHASRDHFSMWIMARGEIRAASIINLKKVADFRDAHELRHDLLQMLKEYRNEQSSGNVIPYEPGMEVTEENVYTLAEGSLGGKGRGLAFIDALIHKYDFNRFIPDIRVRTPKTFVVGTREFEMFIKNNQLEGEVYTQKSFYLLKKQFINGELSSALMTKLESLLSNITKPIAVRSSGLFEDSLTQPFAGVFETYLLPNNHPDIKVRTQQTADAIKLVFASVYSTNAKGYVKAIDYKIEDEKMAVVIQEVVGNQFDNYYYPHISGVAQSYNFYPFAHMKPEEGFAIMALGLGRYVVDGNKAYRFSPHYPGTEINSTKDQFRNSQVNFYAVDLNKQNLNLLEGEMAGLAELDIEVAEYHGSLKHCVSVYHAESDNMYPGLSKTGPRIVNFANVVRYNYIPLAKTIELVLGLGKDAMGNAVEIEFAVDLEKDDHNRASFYILQIKPLISNTMECQIDLEEEDKDSILLYSEKGMGNGIVDDVTDVIYVDLNKFDKTKTQEMALEIESLNQYMIEQKRKYVLIGPGRWGTRDRWIGIPVKWHMISNARVIVETAMDDFPLEASSGSHFFHNVTSMSVGYFTVQPELSTSYINFKMLDDQLLVYQGEYFKHIRFKTPVKIKMDGRKRIYLISV
ncbi:MAG: pyruvate, phosphate dikinase [Bacteroidetes bacterium CG18_big_fil_WC_8_21_14_2_50_41_14]|nr:MAG: pyruvate, phosphate dikinase [Bacteroidetes bacterium CG18_big_fil_WC_8_21_14_2_50_41_14]